MFVVFLELRQVVDIVDLRFAFIGRAAASDPETDKPLRLHLLEEFEMLAFAVRDDRRQDHQPRVFGQGQHRIDHLRYRLRLQRDAVIGAIGRADPRVQQAQVVVDFGHRADRRARVVRGGFLLDRDRGRQAFDQVDVRLFHQLQELARVGRQALDVAALAFGVQSIECQRRLSRS